MSMDKAFPCDCGDMVKATYLPLPMAWTVEHGDNKIGVPDDEWQEWGEKPHWLWLRVLHTKDSEAPDSRNGD